MQNLLNAKRKKRVKNGRPCEISDGRPESEKGVLVSVQKSVLGSGDALDRRQTCQNEHGCTGSGGGGQGVCGVDFCPGHTGWK